MSKRFQICRLSQAETDAFIRQHHRHHLPPPGDLFRLGCIERAEMRVCGVVVVGRPVSRMRDDGRTAEVTRLCTDGTPNACSFLYGAAARAAFALGFERIGTYILASETGATLKAAGWRWIGESGGGSWSRHGRPRVDAHPTGPKTLWETGR